MTGRQAAKQREKHNGLGKQEEEGMEQVVNLLGFFKRQHLWLEGGRKGKWKERPLEIR